MFILVLLTQVVLGRLLNGLNVLLLPNFHKLLISAGVFLSR